MMARPKPDEPYHRFSLRLPGSLWLRFYQRVRELGYSANETIVEMVKWWLEKPR